VRFSTENWCF